MAYTEQPQTDTPIGLGAATHLGRTQLEWKAAKLTPLMKNMGVRVIRDEISWTSVEQVKGEYRIPAVDEDWFNTVTSAGIKVILTLDYGNKLYATEQDKNGLNPEAFAKYAAFIARHFNGKSVIAYEIWNEPHNCFFLEQYGGVWNGRDNSPWIAAFAELIEKSAAAIKAEDPNATIITSAGDPPQTVHLMQRFPKAFMNIDGLTIHPYTFRLPPETVPWGGKAINDRDDVQVADDEHSMVSHFRLLHEHAKRCLGRDLSVWVTEFGYPTFSNTQLRGMYAGYTNEAQGIYHARAFIQAMGCKQVYVWCIYDFKDDFSPFSDNWEAHFGVVDYAADTLKPAYYSLQRVAQLLGEGWQSLGAPVGKLDYDASVNKPFDIWNTPPVEEFALIRTPQLYWFKVTDGYIAFLWKAGPINAEFMPGVGAIQLKGEPNIESAISIDLLTGEKHPIEVGKNADGIRLENLPIQSVPLALKLVTSAELAPM